MNSWAGQKQKWQKSESESEDYLSSDSDLESELDISAKDDSRRKKKAPPPAAQKGPRRDGCSRAITGSEDRVRPPTYRTD